MLNIIDYGVGNLGSLINIHKSININASVASQPDDILNASHLILPGVGSFDNGMKKLNDSGLRDALEYAVITKKIPILGICLGMQLMTRKSEEGDLEGLGWIDAETVQFDLSEEYKIPHIGWNNVSEENPNNLLNSSKIQRFYFVHSYHVRCPEIYTICKTDYGIRFTSAFKNENIYGVQFHPEKSHNFGKKLLKNFSLL
tara:strand:- start:681 stop:1280 length:600 start_codon:yes stop_codon:yes gene_type:complete